MVDANLWKVPPFFFPVDFSKKVVENLQKASDFLE